MLWKARSCSLVHKNQYFLSVTLRTKPASMHICFAFTFSHYYVAQMFRPLSRNAIAHHPGFKDSLPGQSLAGEPLGFIDIGARGGVHSIMEPIAECTAVLGFDADETECARLLGDASITSAWKRMELEAVALADAQGERMLHLMSWEYNHSLLPPQRTLPETLRHDGQMATG